MPRRGIVQPTDIAKQIYIIRGHRVMLSTDLAGLYEVEPRVLVQAVKRNIVRFPRDFMLQLGKMESRILKSQSVISSWGGTRTPPYAFTEQGVAMLASVLHSKRAIEVNIEIMRAFVRLREVLAGNEDLARRLSDLEKKYDTQFRTHDAHFRVVFEAIQELLAPTVPPARRRIGFGSGED
jgi:ORF6N domain-containing protein